MNLFIILCVKGWLLVIYIWLVVIFYLKFGRIKMEFSDVIKNRISIRKFTKQPVEKEKIDSLLKTMAVAPSASNRQKWKFVAVTDKETLEKLTVAAESRPPVSLAPLVFCICSTENIEVNDSGLNRGTIDGSIASTYLHLATTDLGLGACWVGSFDQKLAAQAIGLPDYAKIISLFAIGYADESPSPRPRRPIEEVISYDKF